MNICVAFLCVIAVGAGIWGWWVENSGSDIKQDDENDEKKPEE